MSSDRKVLARAIVLADAAARMIRANEDAQGMTVRYDEAECDGSCLADDCETLIEEGLKALGITTIQQCAEVKG